MDGILGKPRNLQSVDMDSCGKINLRNIVGIHSFFFIHSASADLFRHCLQETCIVGLD